MTTSKPKDYTYVNGAGLTVPAAIVAHNADGTVDLFATEDTGSGVKLFRNVALGEGGGYYQAAE